MAAHLASSLGSTDFLSNILPNRNDKHHAFSLEHWQTRAVCHAQQMNMPDWIGTTGHAASAYPQIRWDGTDNNAEMWELNVDFHLWFRNRYQYNWRWRQRWPSSFYLNRKEIQSISWWVCMGSAEEFFDDKIHCLDPSSSERSFRVRASCSFRLSFTLKYSCHLGWSSLIEPM